MTDKQFDQAVEINDRIYDLQNVIKSIDNNENVIQMCYLSKEHKMLIRSIISEEIEELIIKFSYI